ncbi:Chey-binding protein, partial [Burkholderia multivorans CF2]
AADSQRAPDHVVEQAVAAAHPSAAAPQADAADEGDSNGDGPHLKITLTGVDAKDQALLVEELGNLGRIVGRTEVGDALTLWLESDVPSDDIVAVCCFVIDESQIRIARGAAPAATQPAAAAQV